MTRCSSASSFYRKLIARESARWIGFVVVLLLNGAVVADAATFESKAECEAMNAQVTQQIKASDQVQAYRLECVAATDLKSK